MELLYQHMAVKLEFVRRQYDGLCLQIMVFDKGVAVKCQSE